MLWIGGLTVEGFLMNPITARVSDDRSTRGDYRQLQMLVALGARLCSCKATSRSAPAVIIIKAFIGMDSARLSPAGCRPGWGVGWWTCPPHYCEKVLPKSDANPVVFLPGEGREGR